MSATAPPRGRRSADLVGAAFASRYTGVVTALAALLVFSVVLAPGSLGSSALLSMLPFAAILAVVAAGQTIVVQQAGIDLSIPGAVSLGAMVMNTVAAGDETRIPLAILAAVGATVLAGVATGAAVAWFSVTPLVATLAMNGLLLGSVLAISGGQNAAPVPEVLTAAALGRTLGVPNLVLLAAAVLAAMTFVTTRSVYGRRFVAVGVSPAAARTAGIRAVGYTVSGFALAGLCYGVAGAMLSGYVGTPSVFAGTAYLLPSIAAVVIGGTALAGGKGSIPASALGALFLTQLDQVVSGAGGPSAVQTMVQGAVILVALSLHRVIGALRRRGGRRSGRVGAA